MVETVSEMNQMGSELSDEDRERETLARVLIYTGVELLQGLEPSRACDKTQPGSKINLA